jgi:hypothetical protein
MTTGTRRSILFASSPEARDLGWPRCYVCKGPVGVIEKHWTAEGPTTIFMVFCHGEIELCELPTAWLDAGLVSLDGVAFLPPKALDR